MSEDYEKNDEILPFTMKSDPSILLNNETIHGYGAIITEGHTSRRSSLLFPLDTVIY
jgi:hypothetical protein